MSDQYKLCHICGGLMQWDSRGHTVGYECSGPHDEMVIPIPEVVKLRAELEKAQADNSKLSELCQAQAGNYQKLQAENERLAHEADIATKLACERGERAISLKADVERLTAEYSEERELHNQRKELHEKAMKKNERLTTELATLHDTINTAERTIDVGPYGGVLAINYMAKGIIFLREMLDKKEAELATATERIRILTEERNTKEGEDYWFHQCMKAEAELAHSKKNHQYEINWREQVQTELVAEKEAREKVEAERDALIAAINDARRM